MFSIYAPHNGKPVEARREFYQTLGTTIRDTSNHGGLILLGDFNARLHRQLPYDSPHIGPYVFGCPTAQPDANSNRNLLRELCGTHGLVVSNTYFDHPADLQITCYNVGSRPTDPALPEHFGQIDFLVCPADTHATVLDVRSRRDVPLASHHFLLLCQIHVDIPKHARPQTSKPDLQALQRGRPQEDFGAEFAGKMDEADTDQCTLNALNAHMVGAFQHAAKVCLPTLAATRHRPWISSATLELITSRSDARKNGDYAREKQLSGKIRASVKADRNRWLDDLLATGDWAEIRKLSKGSRARQGRMKDATGAFVDSDQRADTLAEYFSTVQWAVRPVSAVDDPTPIGPDLPVARGPIRSDEVCNAAKKLKRNRASGDDDIPGEFWKAICRPSTAECEWATILCNRCWTEKAVPDAWHEAIVTALFKKGDSADCANYRPISLLPIGYKLYATVLLNRLKEAGAERRIWGTQFGFRSGHGTSDALFIARRLIENAWEARSGKLVMLALDWAKAFDSVSPDSLVQALVRFGATQEFAEAVRAIYSDRSFRVRDAGATSASRPQAFGVSQGCPLSPFLFSIVMTILMHDATRAFRLHGLVQGDGLHISELTYADDTLVVGVQDEFVSKLMCEIQRAGANYGLAFNWGKIEVMPVRCETDLDKPDGKRVPNKESMVYLGGLLSASGKNGPELSRRIGMATADFETLCKVWKHARVTLRKKIAIFESCIMSKLLYCMHTLWLNRAECSKLDAFQARCLRRLAGIGHSYYSRISNATVLQRCDVQKFSSVLTFRQLMLLGKIAGMPNEHPVRKCVFHPGSFDLALPSARRKGRPRNTWKVQVHALACNAAGGRERLHALWGRDPAGVEWRNVSRHYSFSA